MKDLRFALRQLIKNPSFTAVAVLTLALGIGAASTVFSLIQGVLLTPPPYRQPDHLVLTENIKTLEDIRADSVASRTFAMKLLGGFAVAACLLAAVGIYGVLSLAAGSRRSEIAIRMAVGAQREDVLRLILGDGLRLGVAGAGLGILVALALSAGLKTYLFGVGPTDPLTLAAMVLVVLAITLATCWLPARRAANTDPLVALRNE